MQLHSCSYYAPDPSSLHDTVNGPQGFCSFTVGYLCTLYPTLCTYTHAPPLYFPAQTSVESPTNQPQPSPSEAATLPSPTHQPPPPAGGLSGGIVAAILILVLALVVSAVVVVGLTVCFLRWRRHHQSRSIAKGANGLSGIGMSAHCFTDKMLCDYPFCANSKTAVVISGWLLEFTHV